MTSIIPETVLTETVLAELPCWQSDMLRRLLERQQLEESDWEEIVANLEAYVARPKEALEILDGRALVHGERTLAFEKPSGDAQASTVLSKVKDVQNAGALRPGTSLNFAPTGLTLIYGNNGTGKTTFSRLLKETCRAADKKDTVQSNVFEAEGTPEFTIEWSRGGEKTEQRRVAGQGPIAELARVSVFDGKCAEQYTSSQNDIAFVPQDVQVFERLYQAIQELQARLKRQIESLKKSRPAFDDLRGEARARARAELTEAAVAELLSDAAKARTQLETLKEKLRLFDRQEEEVKVATKELRLWDNRTREFSAASDGESLLPAIRKAEADLARAEAESKAAREELEGFPLSGVATSPWHNMWRASQRFLEESRSDRRVVEGEGSSGSDLGAGDAEAHDHCALCQQVHSRASKERFQRFAEIAKSEVESSRAAAQARLAAVRSEATAAKQAITAYLSRYQGDSIAGEIAGDALSDRETSDRRTGDRKTSDVTTDLEWLTALGKRLAAALDSAACEHAENPSSVAGIEDERAAVALALDSRTSRAKRALETIQGLDSAQAATTRSACEEARALARVLECEERLSEAAQIDADLVKLGFMLKNLGLRTITKQVKALAEERLAGKLIKEFESARKDLLVGHLGVEMDSMTRKGQPRTELRLSGAGASQAIGKVFSNGEQNSTALAFFLAEVASADHNGPIVFDDPMSSLDASRREGVATRLAKEAERRQVIVFTHDAAFASLLASRVAVTSATTEWRTLSRTNSRAGIVSEGAPLVCMRCSKLAKQLKNKVKEARKYDKECKADAYELVVAKFHNLLRASYERLTVEMFGEVVQPGKFAVSTGRLSKVRYSDELVAIIHAGMTESSFRMHDQGMELSMHMPSLSELEAKLERFESAVEMLK